MKASEIVVGEKYVAKVAGKITTVHVDLIRETSYGTRYDVTNCVTRRSTTFKSAAKFRSKAKPFEEPMPAIEAATVEGEQSADFISNTSNTADESSMTTCAPTPSNQPSNPPYEPSHTPSPAGASTAESTDATPSSSCETQPTDDAAQSAVPSAHVPTSIASAFAAVADVPAPPARKYPLTDEQQAIVETAPREQVLVIEAGAGAGKTSTLVELASALGGRGQYTAFNTSLVAESAAKFPMCCPCNTIHSLGFRSEGRRFAHRLRQSRVFGSEVAAMLGVSDMVVPGADGSDKKLPSGVLASVVTRAVKTFCQSADREVGLQHFGAITGVTFDAAAMVHAYLLPYARAMWEDLQRTDGKLPYTHDAYVKIWQMNDPVISADYVLLDEAQDTSPVMLDVLAQQVRRGTRVILVGDSAQCQPSGTMVTVIKHYRKGNSHTGFLPTTFTQVPIESVKPGDVVASYDVSRSFFRRTGNAVLKTASRPYRGEMIDVYTTDTGKESAYTPEHRCVVRIGDALNNKWVVYLMRRNKSFRVGIVKGIYESQAGNIGLPSRMRAEGADCAWILSTYDTESEARVQEALLAWSYGVPSLRFKTAMKYGMPQNDLDKFWHGMGDLSVQAETILHAFGRLINHPICTQDKSMLRNRGSLIAACNLLDGMLMLPMTGAMNAHGKRAVKNNWETVIVTRRYYDGIVHSLQVANDETYVADGIITHNSIYSWRGAINALAAFPDAKRLMLSMSFRFGPVIAEVANAVLGELQDRSPLVMRGFDKIKSRLGALDSPRAVLCRTNAAAVATLLDAITRGKRPHLIGGGDEVLKFVNAAQQLQAGKRTSHPELATFETWGEVKAYSDTDEGEDLKLMVKLIDKFTAAKIAGALKNMPREEDADLVVSTAHKSKGREWDTVKLAGDFMPLGKMGDEELRLLYVAATRAKKVLDVEQCAPFCGGEREVGDEGRVVRERAIDLREARRLSKELTTSADYSVVDNTATVGQFDAVATINEQTYLQENKTAPATRKDEGNTWTKSKRGEWCVRGKPGQSGEVEVVRRNGSKSKERLGKVIWQDAEVALYAVEGK